MVRGAGTGYPPGVRWLLIAMLGMAACTADNPAFDEETEGGATTSGGGATTDVTTGEAETSTGSGNTGGSESTGDPFSCDMVPPGQRFRAQITNLQDVPACATVNANGRLEAAGDGTWVLSCDAACGGQCEEALRITYEGGSLGPVTETDCVLLYALFDQTDPNACALSVVTVTRLDGQDIMFAGGNHEPVIDPIGSALFQIEPHLQRECPCPGEIGECCWDTPGMYSLEFQNHGVELQQGESEVVETQHRRLRIENLRSQVRDVCIDRPDFEWVMRTEP